MASKDPASPQIPIIGHPDIRRMLLFQRAIVEGSLSLLCQCGKYSDIKTAATGEDQGRAAMLLDFLTPVAKTYPAEMGIHSVSAGLQCLGGYGYCDEFPMEQHYRDARIHPIHEGTTGIHSITLLGRNITINEGQAYKLYLEEVNKAISEANKDEFLKPFAEKLTKAVEKLKDVTDHLLGIAGKGNQELFLADATLYMEFFGIIAVGWQWLLQAIAARKALQQNSHEADVNFYQGKLFTCRYFFGYELPKIMSLATRLMDSDGLTLQMKEEYYTE
jgi:butyryl-CoA dehydrogenase